MSAPRPQRLKVRADTSMECEVGGRWRVGEGIKPQLVTLLFFYHH
jgi:hypothetical protein